MYDLIAEFLLVKRAIGRAKSTICEYRHYLTSFAGHCGKSLDDITNADLARWLVAEQTRRPLAPPSIAARFRAVRTFFNWCVENGYLAQSPVKMKPPRVPAKAPRVAPMRSLQQLLGMPVEHWVDYRDRALLSLLLDTGMRIGEACSLALSDFDFDRRIVRVPAGKDKEDRLAPFTTHCAEHLHGYLAHRPQTSIDAVFLRSRRNHVVKGRMLVCAAQWMIEKRCRDLAIVPRINLHSIRHAFAMKALNDGIRAEVVSKILGHASVDFTLKVYASLLIDTIRYEYDQRWRSWRP